MVQCDEDFLDFCRIVTWEPPPPQIPQVQKILVQHVAKPVQVYAPTSAAVNQNECGFEPCCFVPHEWFPFKKCKAATHPNQCTTGSGPNVYITHLSCSQDFPLYTNSRSVLNPAQQQQWQHPQQPMWRAASEKSMQQPIEGSPKEQRPAQAPQTVSQDNTLSSFFTEQQWNTFFPFANAHANPPIFNYTAFLQVSYCIDFLIAVRKEITPFFFFFLGSCVLSGFCCSRLKRAAANRTGRIFCSHFSVH